MGFLGGLITGAIFSSTIFGIIEYVQMQVSNPENYSKVADKILEYAPQVIEKVQ